LLRGDPRRTEAVERFGRECCNPPLQPTEIRGALRQADKRPLKIGDLKIGDWLPITPDENDRIEGDYLKPKPLQPASPRKESMATRRSAILEICADGVPSLGRIKRRLRDLGVQTTRQTISQDLAALRLSNPRSPRQASRSRLVSSRDSRAKSRKGVQGLHICSET
jgi:hypothetical protein